MVLSSDTERLKHGCCRETALSPREGNEPLVLQCSRLSRVLKIKSVTKVLQTQNPFRGFPSVPQGSFPSKSNAKDDTESLLRKCL